MSTPTLKAAPLPWRPDSWRSKRALQLPSYPDRAEVDRVMAEISQLPPLVTSWEVEGLKQQLAEAASGKYFLLQGGDCAESFEDCRSDIIANKLKILLQMSLVLVLGTRRRVVRVGRFAGQYAKPRSEDLETQDGVTLHTYRGDLINRLPFTEGDRTPDPQRMLRGYERSALTLNFIRGLIEGGFADLHHTEYWDLGFVQHSPHAREYQQMVDSISESIKFMDRLGYVDAEQMRRVDFFSSHEGLHLPYEQAQTRQVPHRTGWYNLATHMPWIGLRTNDPDGAHVEYFRGIANPVGVKVGPGTDRETLLRLLDTLHPDDEPGRLTLIHRFGAGRIADELPKIVRTVQESGKTVLWCCDPMHGNTEKLEDGTKTRRFDNIRSELEQALDLHDELGSRLGGVHFELTGDDVTECVGGARGLREADLKRAYRSQVDPRLNYEQALELAMVIARHLNAASADEEE